MKRFVLGLILMGVVLASAAALPLLAQDTTATPPPTPAAGSEVMVVGPVTFEDGDLIVSGYIIAPAGAFRPSILSEGDLVIITGILLPDGQTIQVRTFEFFEDPEVTPDPTGTPEANETPEAVETPEPTDDACDRPDHPVAQQLADAFAVSYAEIIGWHCAGFGFGEIARAYLLADQTGETAATYFEQKAGGAGWGEIVRDAGITGSDHSALAPGQNRQRDSEDTADVNGQGNGNGNGQGNGNGNGRGNGNGNGNGGGNGNGNGRGNGNGNGNGQGG